jgi:hypothetical protein
MREKVHQLLYQGLLKLSSMERDRRARGVVLFARLLIPMPLELEKAARGETSYEQVLRWLKTNIAHEEGTEWLRGVI